MKDKLLLFIIGVLVGAIIATGAFYVYNKSTSTCTTNNTQMTFPGGNPPSMSDNQNGEPPAKPGESNTGMSTNTQNSQSNN